MVLVRTVATCLLMTAGCEIGTGDAAAARPDDDVGGHIGARDQDATSDGAAHRSSNDAQPAVDTEQVDADPTGSYPGDCPLPDDPPIDRAQCTFAPPTLFKADTRPLERSLVVQIGQAVTSTDAFAAYGQYQCVPFVFGPQGGFHIRTALRVVDQACIDRPNAHGCSQAGLRKFMVQARVYLGCEPVTADQNASLWLRGTGHAGLWTTVSKFGDGFYVPFPAKTAKVGEYVRKWYTIRIAVRRPGTDDWGQAEITLRAFAPSIN